MLGIMVIPFFLTLFSLANLFGIRPQLVGTEFIYYLIGLAMFFLFRSIGWRAIRDNARPLYWIFIFLLVFTYVLGLEVKGSRRWIDLYFFNFQASEFLKVFFIVFLADFFARHRKNIDEFSVFVKSLIYFGIPAFIILKQPDLGNAAVYAFVYAVMLFFSSVPKKTIFTIFLIVVISLPLAWLGLHDYQKARITSFMSPQEDQSGASYNMVQAMITVGSGQFFGRGLGQGTQSKLFFLPENHTDFAYSSLVEQFGFFGGICLLIFYFVFIFIIIRRLQNYYPYHDSETFFKFLYTLGILGYLVFQIFVNIGMNLGIVPVAGIALPFISYGGSALVATMIGLALLP